MLQVIGTGQTWSQCEWVDLCHCEWVDLCHDVTCLPRIWYKSGFASHISPSRSPQYGGATNQEREPVSTLEGYQVWPYD